MLQTRTVEPGTLGLLKELMAVPEIAPFYLVEGTALALQIGHRFSVDLDLFTLKPFDTSKLHETLNGIFDVSIESESSNMLITFINDVKVDFVKMSYPLLYASIEVDAIRMLEIRDIAPMKLKAVTQRGSKKDFFDIYFLLNNLSLEEMLGIFQEKFKQQTVFHVLKSLTYFEDAEKYADPVVFDNSVTWEIVKSTVRSAVKDLSQ